MGGKRTKFTLNPASTKLLQSKLTNGEVAKLLGLTPNYVSLIRVKHGWNLGKNCGPRNWPKDKLELLVKLFHEGMTDTQIGHAIGCSRASASSQRKRLGLQLDPEEARSRKQGHDPKPPLPAQPTTANPIPPLSPAMRHLAQFDTIIANRLQLQKEWGAEAPQVTSQERTGPG